MVMNEVIFINMNAMLLPGWKSCIQDIRLKICLVPKAIPAAKPQNFVDISGAKAHMGKLLGIWFFYLKRQGYNITRKNSTCGHIIFMDKFYN